MFDADTIRKLIINGKYELSKHAEKEREIDKIYMWELEAAFRNCRVIENYPDDPRGPSCLILGFCGLKPIHSVCTVRTNPEELLLITIYDPSSRPDKWENNFSKRR